MASVGRQIHLAGFLIAGPVVHSHAVWRHPLTTRRFTDIRLYEDVARVLEDGLFDFVFFADRLGVSDQLGGSRDLAFRYGAQDAARLDPLPIVSFLAGKTSHIGLGVTRSTTYYQPNHIVRSFTTLDHLSGGRGAWNVVTSMNDSEGRIFGQAQHMDHDRRYDRADEFMEVVLGHWDSWQDDALVVDKQSGLFAHPDKVARLDHAGRYFRSRGPFTVPRSAQGHPVLIQAGSSGRGKRFAARWAELVFTAYPNIASGRRDYADFKDAVAKQGRNPDHVKVATLTFPITAATKTEAEDRMAVIDSGFLEIDALSLLSEALNFDFATKGLDDSFSKEELDGITGMHAMRDRVLQLSGKPNPTVRDFIKFTGRGRASHPIVGGPKDVADAMEAWFVEGACDGFVIGATDVPGTFEDFVHFVVPELQRRGLFRKEYEGTTLREHLGLPKPAVGAWRKGVKSAAE
jgi:FMN-dependent oxidoreductase (nitrilotriacetate monooxygenase family)